MFGLATQKDKDQQNAPDNAQAVSGSPAPNQNREAADRAGQQVVEKHLGKRGPGRPRKNPTSAPIFHGNNSRPLTQGSPGLQGAPSVSASPPVDPALVKQGVASVLKAVDAVIVRRVYRITVDLSGDEKLAKELACDIGLTKDESELMANLSAVLCEKYQIAGTYAPEILLVLAVTGWGTRSFLMFRKLRELADARKKTDAEEQEKKAA